MRHKNKESENKVVELENKEGLEETAMGWYWFIKPTGDNRKMYEREVRADILLNIQENGKKEQNEATR